MIPVLFPASATTFTTNGLGGLSDCISCHVMEERNGEYTLEMEYPEGGAHFSEITNSTIIWAKLDAMRNYQAFRVYKITRPLNGKVKVLAQHISYQLSMIPCGPFTANTVGDALLGLKNHAAESCPFTFSTDKATSATYTLALPASIRSCLGGTKGSILDVYGGEYEFDNYTVHLWAARGQDRGVTLRYGKNITDVTQEENIANTVTGVYPYYNSENGGYVELPEKVISAPSAANYPYPRTVPLDCTNEFDDAPTEAQLRSYATSYVAREGIGVPKVNIKVKFINLADTEEYADRAALERVCLCDTLTVIYEKLGVTTTAKVVRTDWDVLLERYRSIEVGDLKTSLASTIAQTQEAAEEAVDQNALSAAITAATNSITGVTGGYIKLNRDGDGHPYELLVMDHPDEADAVNIWRWNVGGWGYSGDGGAHYTMAATIGGGIVADYITAGTLTGLKINNGNGTFYVNENGEVTAAAINITGGSVNIRGASDQTQIIQLDFYSGGSRVVGTAFMPSGVEVNGTSGGNTGIAKLNPANVSAQEIYDLNGVSQLRTAYMTQYGMNISDTGTGESANYNAAWYTQIDRLYNTGTVTSATSSTISVANSSWATLSGTTHGSGTYLVMAFAEFASNATGRRSMFVTSSTSSTTAVQSDACDRAVALNGVNTSMGCTFVFKANASGQLFIRVWHNAGAALNSTASRLTLLKICD